MADEDRHDGSPADPNRTTAEEGDASGPMRIEIVDEEPEGEDEDQVARLEREIVELRDRSIRTLADFENYRKRIERERRDDQRYAAFEPYRRILEVVDNLERALEAGGSADDLKTGVELILRQILELLRGGGVQRVPALGQPFDPNFHEAVARFEDPDVAEPTVSDEMQAGYRMHDRLLRPAIVRVAMPEESAEKEPDVVVDEPDGPPPIH